MYEGWITLNREVSKHWVFKDAEYFRAWVTILMEVNHSENKVLIGKTLFTCARGESLRSLESWGEIFGNWGKSKTKRFFDLLKKDSMIELKNERLSTRLSVCNYDKYQDSRNADETQVKRKRNADETQVKQERATNNNELTMINNENNENNEKKHTINGAESVLQFSEFWNIYAKKVDSKKCEDAYKKISEVDRQKIKDVVSKYVSATSEIKFRKNPLTWLNGKCWNDEIIENKVSCKVQTMTEENKNYYQSELGF